MTAREIAERGEVVEIARSWLGTPFHDHAAVKGAGVDCGQLLRMVYTESGRVPPIEVGYYSPQWHLHREEEVYLNLVKQYGREVAAPKPGDAVLLKVGKCFSHGGIVIDWPRIIHASGQARCVELFDVSTSALARAEMKFFSPWETE